jgi:hypothetical protein
MGVNGQLHASDIYCSTNAMEGWVGLRAILEVLEKRTVFCPSLELNSKSCSLYPSHYTNYTTQAPGDSNIVNIILAYVYVCDILYWLTVSDSKTFIRVVGSVTWIGSGVQCIASSAWENCGNLKIFTITTSADEW